MVVPHNTTTGAAVDTPVPAAPPNPAALAPTDNQQRRLPGDSRDAAGGDPSDPAPDYPADELPPPYKRHATARAAAIPLAHLSPTGRRPAAATPRSSECHPADAPLPITVPWGQKKVPWYKNRKIVFASVFFTVVTAIVVGIVVGKDVESRKASSSTTTYYSPPPLPSGGAVAIFESEAVARTAGGPPSSVVYAAFKHPDDANHTLTLAAVRDPLLSNSTWRAVASLGLSRWMLPFNADMPQHGSRVALFVWPSQKTFFSAHEAIVSVAYSHRERYGVGRISLAVLMSDLDGEGMETEHLPESGGSISSESVALDFPVAIAAGERCNATTRKDSSQSSRSCHSATDPTLSLIYGLNQTTAMSDYYRRYQREELGLTEDCVLPRRQAVYRTSHTWFKTDADGSGTLRVSGEPVPDYEWCKHGTNLSSPAAAVLSPGRNDARLVGQFRGPKGGFQSVALDWDDRGNWNDPDEKTLQAEKATTFRNVAACECKATGRTHVFVAPLEGGIITEYRTGGNGTATTLPWLVPLQNVDPGGGTMAAWCYRDSNAMIAYSTGYGSDGGNGGSRLVLAILDEGGWREILSSDA